MTFLPIVARELRVTARRSGTFWTRTAVALVAIVTGTFFFLANIEAPSQVIGRRIFLGLLALSILFALYAGRRFTADCLSEEKRQGTLGLLFLTDLRGLDIVLGKLAATSLNGFLSLLAVFPVLAVPLLLGGITNGEFWRVLLVLAVSFVFSLSVGIFASALTRETRQAMGINLLLLLLIIGIPGACAAALAYGLPGNKLYPQLLLSCPFYSLYLCDDAQYRFQQSNFWWSVGVLHGLTWLLLGTAGWVVRHTWQDRPSGPRRFSWVELRRFLKFGPASQRAEYRRRLLNSNPFYWLAARSRYKPLQVWGVVLCIAGWWIWAHWQFGSIWLDEFTSGTNIATAIMLNVALKLWVGLEAGRQLAEERQSGSFELLMSTPLGVREVLTGQRLALTRQFLIPTLFSTLAVVLFMINALRHAFGDRTAILAAWLGALLVFVADLLALFWTAMYCALTAHSPNQAAVSTISRILIAPGVVFGAIVALASFYSYLAGQPVPKLGFYMVCWMGLGLATDLTYGLATRRRLLRNFRLLGASTKAVKMN